MTKDIVVDTNPHETRVALLEDRELVEIQIEMKGHERLVGNIYKGKVANILPGMQAAFVDVGLERNAFLYAGDILGNSEMFEEDAPKPEKANIKDLLKQGQELIVQVIKQQGGTKGVRVSTHITLPGRMMVLMPTVDHIGISRRIADEAERERLREIFSRIKPKGVGVIVRTASTSADEEEFDNEIKFLGRLWERIKSRGDILTAPRLIHSEESLLFRAVRDMLGEEVDNFFVNDKEQYEKVLALANILMPSNKTNVVHFQQSANIFDYFNIEAKIEKALQRNVWLKSGSYIVIDETEALTAIDVNTGKYTGDNDLQQTILNTNLEAAVEIARQLRLRDIGGIVVIDFIDMDDEENKRKVIAALESALTRDRVKCNVLGMTALGLVEMTRKKVRQKVSGLLYSKCPNCSARGKVYSDQAMAMRVRREVCRIAEGGDSFIVEISPSVRAYILEMNSQNSALLPPMEGKTFYLVENKSIHKHEIKVSPFSPFKQKEHQDMSVFY